MNKKSIFSVAITLLTKQLLADRLCSDVTSSSLILNYCKNGSKCIIEDLGGTGINNQIKCECLIGYGLPDCSLRK